MQSNRHTLHPQPFNTVPGGKHNPNRFTMFGFKGRNDNRNYYQHHHYVLMLTELPQTGSGKCSVSEPKDEAFCEYKMCIRAGKV